MFHNFMSVIVMLLLCLNIIDPKEHRRKFKKDKTNSKRSVEQRITSPKMILQCILKNSSIEPLYIFN